MWLAETAADISKLEALARAGIKFTVLAQHQAWRVRKLGGRNWKDVSGGRIDPSRAYLARLPSGNKISLFFYDGAVSQAVAFEKLLDSGEAFANRLKTGFSDKRTWPQLMHIATDGETYGHHHYHGDMALAFALDHIESNNLRITNYGEFLANNPPEQEVEIVQNTSWSCTTAWSGGEVIVAATQAGRDGTRNGVHHCVTHSITSAMPPRNLTRSMPRWSKTPGRHVILH